MPINFPVNPLMNQVYTNLDRTWQWNGRYWQAISTSIGYSGSIGFTGSQGNIGFVGSVGDTGYTGSIGSGYTGSQGNIGFSGSRGLTGFTGSAADESKFLKFDPDGDGIAVAYSDQNAIINGVSCGGGWYFGADGNINRGLLDARFFNARNGHVNSSGGYYVGTIDPLEAISAGTYTTTQIITGNGLITPTSGNTADRGIKFADNPGGGTGDTAWIRYYAHTGESTNLEIGVANDGTDSINLVSSGGVGINRQSPTEALHVTGNILATGVVNSVSDARLKTDIRRIENPLELVLQLDGVFYNTLDNKPGTGVIAQQVESAIPCLVNTDREGIKSVSYGNFAGIFIECIKELTEQVRTLQAEVNRLSGNI